MPDRRDESPSRQGFPVVYEKAVPIALYLGELFGAVLMFPGFIRATTPMRSAQPAPESTASAQGAPS
jgi:hypothetical protein